MKLIDLGQASSTEFYLENMKFAAQDVLQFLRPGLIRLYSYLNRRSCHKMSDLYFFSFVYATAASDLLESRFNDIRREGPATCAVHIVPSAARASM